MKIIHLSDIHVGHEGCGQRFHTLIANITYRMQPARDYVIVITKVICLHHHPFDFKLGRQLKDSDNLKEIIENKIDALLFGHYHRSKASVEKILNGEWGIPRCYNAGTATHKNNNPGFHRVIDLSNPDTGSDYDGCFLQQ